ncbi:MAG: hypothetical protein U9M95_02930, partial [Candidatus Altiarchaeota archaeon]|nr:hypothetical protein [Candidatus Altiarchaeota archaeon]
GLYNITVNASIINDSNISDNFRSRVVRLVYPVHDFSISLDYNGSFQGIKIVETDTGKSILNNSGNLTVLNLDGNYNISYQLTNLGGFNDSAFSEIKLVDESGVRIQKKAYVWGMYGNTIGQSKEFTLELNTSLTVEGFHNLTAEILSLMGFYDNNPSDNSRTRVIYLNKPPQVSAHSPINGTYSGNVELNFTASDVKSNLSSLWYLLDGKTKKIGDVTGNTASCNKTITLPGGVHKLQVCANDSFGYVGCSEEIELTIQAPVNASRFIQELVGVEHVKSASLLDAGNNTINYSGDDGIIINNTFTLLFRLESNITVKIPSFSGLDMNWNQAPLLEIYNLSDSGNWMDELEDLLGVEFQTLLYFNNTEELLADQDYLEGAVIQLDWNLSSDLQLVYLPDEQEPVILKECNDAGGTMCYLNTPNNLTIRLPHLSGVALWNDTRAPEKNKNRPGNKTIKHDSMPPANVFMFKVKEINPKPQPEVFCRYMIESGDGLVKRGSINVSISTRFLDEKYTFNVEGLLDGFYNFTVNCSDVYGKTSTLKHNFIVNDTTPPAMRGEDTDVEYSSGYKSAEVAVEVDTNEKSTCRYDTKDKSYTSMKYKMHASSSGMEHDDTYPTTFTQKTSGKFYIRCRDLNGNDVEDYVKANFEINRIRKKDDGDDDDDSGGGITGVPSKKKSDEGSCFDLIENCHDGACERGIDCDGPCMPCPSCSDRRQNQGESGIDCGGPCLPCKTTTSTTTTTTTTTTYTTTSTSSTTTSTRKIVYQREKKEEAPAVTGMVTGFDLFGMIISFIVLAFLLLITAVSVYAYRNSSTGKKQKRPYELKSTRRGTRLGDV